jgi:hypothetical protein
MPRKNLFKHRSDDEDEDHFDYEKPKQIKTLGKLPKGVKKLSDEPQKLTPTQIKHLHNINFEKLKTSKRSGASQNPVNNNNNTKGSLRSNFKQYPFPKEAQKFLKPVKYGPKNSAANRKATIPKPPPRPDPDHPPVTRRVFARPMQNKVADRFKMPRKIMAMPNPDKVETFTNYKKRRLAEVEDRSNRREQAERDYKRQYTAFKEYKQTKKTGFKTASGKKIKVEHIPSA